MKFLLTGGGQREKAVWEKEWNRYEQAVIVELDWETQQLSIVKKYLSPEKVIAGEKANIVFKAGSLHGNFLYICTQTEIIVYKYPEMEQLKYCSLSCFNDIHHVDVFGNNVAVVSTGLDMVVMLNKDLEPIEYINVLGEDPGSEFSGEIDYRKVLTTQPHQSHPNYFFEIDGEPWVTRFVQKDAVCLVDRKKRIDIGVERVHDGIVKGDYVYFTAVNGFIVVVNKLTYKKEAIYDLNECYTEKNPLGWCRGLHVENDEFYVGFSALRSTKFRENLAWMKRGFSGNINVARARPTRIVRYNFREKNLDSECLLSNVGLDAVFSILKLN